MRTIAIITARGGSKRIPRKNIRDFCGSPIISYSIDAAINSNIFAEVMVSTDDNEIAKIALENGAQVPFYRSSRNSDDYSTTADVLIEVLSEYEKKGLKFDYLCCIYPTAPFVTSEKLKLALKNECGMDKDFYSYDMANIKDTKRLLALEWLKEREKEENAAKTKAKTVLILKSSKD